MTDGLDEWRGGANAKLDMLQESVRNIQGKLEMLAEDMASLKATAAKVEDVAALKATARAWGTFAGFVSGLAVSVAAKLWRS